MSRLTFTELQNISKDYISKSSGSFAASTVANFIKQHLNTRYHFVQRKLRGYIQQDLPKTASTVEDQQYYHYPPSIYPPITSATLDIGDIDYPLDVISSQRKWDELNQITTAGTTIPQFIFPRRDDFGLWPIPGADGDTITFLASMVDRDMTIEDYTTGTVTVTENDETIAGAGTVWTAAFAGRWFKTTVDGIWYRIASFTSGTSMELETVFEGTTAAGGNYTIAETPEIPPELHEILANGVAADFYSGPAKDFGAAQAHNNYFWTGDYGNSNRDMRRAAGGLLDAMRRYSYRSDSKVINKRRGTRDLFDERWTSTLEDSA